MQPEGALVWTEDQLLENVRRVVRALMSIRDVDVDWLAEGLGLRRTATYNRLARERESRFTAAEIYRMARLFQVPVEVFFEPVEDLFGGGHKRRYSTPYRPQAA